MNICLFLAVVTTQLFLQPAQVERVPILREGTKIANATGTLDREKQNNALVMTLEREDAVNSELILLPNQRLAEMEAVAEINPENRFRISGDVFAFGGRNFLLVKEAVSLQKHAQRNHPTVVPIDPNKTAVEREDLDDSVADIVRELEEATGSLVRSIRNAADNPIAGAPSQREGARITARRCHLVRNNDGAWIAVFVSDVTGLSDPPVTVLPGTIFESLVKSVRGKNQTIPVLLTGELLDYHGHGFLALQDWRPVHSTDHLP